MIQKEQASRKRIETRALNVCRSRPSLEYVEDLEENEAPVQTREAEYEPGDRLFMTRILPDSTAEDLRTTSITSQKLAEGARRSAVTPLENFLWKCSMGYTLYPWISLLEPTLETSYKPQT